MNVTRMTVFLSPGITLTVPFEFREQEFGPVLPAVQPVVVQFEINSIPFEFRRQKPEQLEVVGQIRQEAINRSR